MSNATVTKVGSPFGTFLRPEGFAGPTGLGALAREGSTVTEMARHVARSRADRRERTRLPYAGPHKAVSHDPVLLIPGFMAGDYTLHRMAVFLRRQGFRTYRSQILLNVGCTLDAAARLEERLERIVERRGRKVSLVGHSLGGMLARGLAGRRPDLIEGIVTMGSPVLAPGAVHQVLAWDAELLSRLNRAGLAGMMSADCFGGACAQESWRQSKAPLHTDFAFTAIYSRRDGIVDWRACLDPAARHVEVRTSHCGMALDPVVMDHVLAALREQQAVRQASAAEAASGTADPRLAAHR